MKKIFAIFAVAIAAIMFNSCGSSKKAATVQDYTVEEVDIKFYFIEPAAQNVTVAAEDLELSFWNELQKAEM